MDLYRIIYYIMSVKWKNFRVITIIGAMHGTWYLDIPKSVMYIYVYTRWGQLHQNVRGRMCHLDG